MADQPKDQGTVIRMLDVVRDATFVRFVADEAVIAPLGRAVEIAFLQYGPIFLSQTDHGEFETTDSKAVVTEVARMRMNYSNLVEMMMGFLQSGIADGRLKADMIQESIKNWAADKLADQPEEDRP
ncbi:hypothetical protein [Sphingomonas bacterium]|uniref:hypothetical protein n=1 Tax=Sphingomonas bacterium TaxID=1895847 RepID=UPI001574FD38|nr:hypothetical protein [Sphingomonas bacterium]